MSRCSRLAPSLVAFALLSASPILSQARPGAAPPRTASFAEALRGFLPDFLVRLWGEEGCGADPYGAACRKAPATLGARPSLKAMSSKEGCRLDPYGGCLNQLANPLPTGH